MATVIDQLLKDVLKTYQVLGINNFPLSEKILTEFLKNEQVVLSDPNTSNICKKPEIFVPRSDIVTKNTTAVTQVNLNLNTSITPPEGSKEVQWAWLKQRVLSCPECLKHVYPGKKLVFGSGNLDADIFFCGEAPGADEETQGEVFVGRAGQLLTKIIEAMGLKRSKVYIGNIMNWRPETPHHIGNRPPTQQEMQFCLPYLIGQMKIVKPKVIVALGATAVSGLLGYDENRRMRDCRGRWLEFQHTPLMVTYHPSYLLRNATKEAKRAVWEDMMQVMRFLGMPLSERQKAYFL